MQTYIINFFVWWYLVRVRDLFHSLSDRFVFLLQLTNTLPMAQNLGRPLYQDNSGIGKLIGWVVRLVWVWFGGIISVFLLIPNIVYFSVNVFLPPVAVGMLVVGLLGIFGLGDTGAMARGGAV